MPSPTRSPATSRTGRARRNLEGLAKNVRLGEDGRYHWHWDPRFRSGERDLDQRQKRLEACARALSLPTLLVRGGLSDILTEEGAREFLELCPHAEYVNVAGAAHMVAGDRNDIFADAVIEFLGHNVPLDGDPIQPPHEPQPAPHGPPGTSSTCRRRHLAELNRSRPRMQLRRHGDCV